LIKKLLTRKQKLKRLFFILLLWRLIK